jgi:hypothetical protein
MDKLLTPQQEMFLASYTNPKSDTFGNALQSALKAGYSQEYSESITYQMPEWLSENIGDMRRLRKAEKNLEEVQNLPIIDYEGKIDTQIVEKRTKVDMFIAERIDKAKYSTRQEFGGVNGKDLIPDKESKERTDEIISSFLNGTNIKNTQGK